MSSLGKALVSVFHLFSELATLWSRPAGQGYICCWVSGSKKGADRHLHWAGHERLGKESQVYCLAAWNQHSNSLITWLIGMGMLCGKWQARTRAFCLVSWEIRWETEAGGHLVFGFCDDLAWGWKCLAVSRITTFTLTGPRCNVFKVHCGKRCIVFWCPQHGVTILITGSRKVTVRVRGLSWISLED